METISIISVVDVVGALAADMVAGSLYLVDNNKAGGSKDEGTEMLQTMVRKGDQVVWVSIPLECEAFISITGVEIDKKFREYCDPKKGVYPDTNVVYWVGEIKKDLDVAIPYTLKFRLGSRRGDMATTSFPALIGEAPATASAAVTSAKTP
ncbi:MAG: hypothetical protein JWQ94_3267 [Tardiphaga sp.]|nr:hypothetical protein [Tardiphaga sp.]